MHDELKRTWKEAVSALWKYYPSIGLEGLRKSRTSVKMAGVWAEIIIEDLRNRGQKPYRWTSLL
jgi:hypothetical protein